MSPVRWPDTKMGKRLAGCPGSLPLGGDQERLPDGSLTVLRSMRTHEIASAIEAEAVDAYIDRLRAAVEGLEPLICGWDGPEAPTSLYDEPVMVIRAAVLAAIEAARTEP